MAFDLRGPFEFLWRFLRHRDETRAEQKDADTLKDMLQNFPKPKRKFATLKGKVKGLDEDEVRRILRSLGAVSFTSDLGEELWGLKSRNPTAMSVDGPSE